MEYFDHLVSSRVEAVGDQVPSGHSAPYGKEARLSFNNVHCHVTEWVNESIAK